MYWRIVTDGEGFGVFRQEPQAEPANQELFLYKTSDGWFIADKYDPKQLVASEQVGQSCDDLCSAHAQGSNSGASSGGGARSGSSGGLKFACEARAFGYANSCEALEARFPCEGGCEESFGLEQPAYVVVPGTPASNLPGACLRSSKPQESSCAAGHKLTRRVCPCVPAP